MHKEWLSVEKDHTIKEKRLLNGLMARIPRTLSVCNMNFWPRCFATCLLLEACINVGLLEIPDFIISADTITYPLLSLNKFCPRETKLVIQFDANTYCLSLFVSLLSHFWRIHFSPTPALSTISRPLSSSMGSITPETANVGSSYNRMRGPGIGCWLSDRANCTN